MGRGIPRVRAWRVTLYTETGPIASVVVDAPTARFARWHARDAFGFALWREAVRASVRPVRYRVTVPSNVELQLGVARIRVSPEATR